MLIRRPGPRRVKCVGMHIHSEGESCSVRSSSRCCQSPACLAPRAPVGVGPPQARRGADEGGELQRHPLGVPRARQPRRVAPQVEIESKV